MAAETAALPASADAAQPPAYPPPPPPGQNPLALIATVMDTTQPAQIRAQAIASLAAEGGDRSIVTLNYLLADRDPEVRLATVAALAALRSAASEAALLAAVRNMALARRTREEALRQLAAQQLETTPAALEALASDKKLSRALSKQAGQELRERYPAELKLRAPELATAPARRPVGGRLVLMGTGAVFGGYTLYGVGKLGRNDSEAVPMLGLLGGAVLGGTAGFLLGSDSTFARSLTLMTTTGLGLWLGMGVGHGLVNLPLGDDRIYLLTIGGEALGMLAGALGWNLLKPLVEPDPALQQGGQYALSVGTAMLGGVALHLVSTLQGEGGPQQFGALSGLVLGASLGNLLGKRITPGHGGYLSTGAAWGLIAGGLGARAAMPRGSDPRALEGLTLLGGALGLTLAEVAWSPRLTGRDVPVVNLAAATGLVLAAGISNLPEPKNDPRAAYGLMAATSAAGLVVGSLLAPRLQFSGGDGMLTGLGAAHGFFAGLAVPGLSSSNPRGHHRIAGMLLGASLGTVVAEGVAQFSELPGRDVTTLGFVDAFGSIAGLGLGLLAAENSASAAPNLGYLVGGTLSLGVGAAVVDKMQFRRGDALLVALAPVWGAWQGVGLSLGLDAGGDRFGGAVLAGVGGFGLASMAISQAIDVSPGTVFAAFSGGVWGTWLATNALLLRSLEQDDMLIILAAGDLGLLGTTALLAAGVAPRSLGIATLGGLAGALAGTLGTSLVTRDGDTVLTATLIGTVAGLAGGMVLSGFTKTDGESAERSEVRRASSLPSLEFKGLTTQPVIGRDGRIDGFALAAMVETR